MSCRGLNTVNLSTLNTFQQVLLFLLIIIGSAVFVSGFVVLVRKRTFEQRFEHIAAARRRAGKNRRRSTSLVRQLSKSLTQPSTRDGPQLSAREPGLETEQPSQGRSDDIIVEMASKESHEKTKGEPTVVIGCNSSLPARPTSACPQPSPTGPKEVPFRRDDQDNSPAHIKWNTDIDHRAEQYNLSKGTITDLDANIKKETVGSSHHSHLSHDAETHLSTIDPSAHISRNSQFHHLSEKERLALGSTEYKAVQLLSWLVPTYSFLFQVLGCLGLGAYVANNRASVARENGLNPWWVGSFNAVSAFNNCGMSLLDANMVAFQTSIYMLMTMGLLILAGNTCYPIFLRLIVWTLLKLLNLLPNHKQSNEFRETLQFLLAHPRRCYTNMFPARHTWWLLISVVALNGIDWVAFEVLNIGNKKIESLPANIEVLDGLFQAFAVRSGGFYVVPIPDVRIGLQVLYVIMMYISVYPVVITMRNSNVYEERSLGIYADDPGYASTQEQSGSGIFRKLRRKVTGGSQPFEQTKSYFVRQQLRAQLAHDLWWIVLAVFLIMVIEGSNFEDNPKVFSVFNVIFETVSAYGCVGISVGLPDQAYSFSGALSTLSKLVLCAVMIRGRHRGLPVAIDKAILLPGEDSYEAEEEDAMIRLERTASRGRVA